MATSPLFQQHHQHTLATLPALARQVLMDTQRDLREAGVDVAMAADRRLVFTVQEALQSHQAAFERTLAQAMVEGVGAALAEQTQRAPRNDPDTDHLCLVDESEAEQAIEVARTVQLLELKAEWEWNQFQACHASLLDETTLHPEANPWRPAVFAQALSLACSSLSLAPEARGLLLRSSGRVLADVLKGFYADARTRLKAQGVVPLPRKAPNHPRPAQRPAPSGLDVTQPGALFQLLQRLPEFAGLAGAAQAWPASAPSMGTPPTTSSASIDGQALRLLTRLLDQMGSDPEVQAPVQGLIRQLQTPLVRLALKDPLLMQSDRHPAWQLVHELVSAAAGFQQADDPALLRFIAFAQPLVRQLATGQAAEQTAEAQRYASAVESLKAQQAEEAQAVLRQHQVQQQALAQADHRETLKPLLRQQVTKQIEGVRLAEPVRQFLEEDWVSVMAHTMSNPSHDVLEAQALLGTVDGLLASLERPATLDAREQLRGELPDLIRRLQLGMDLVRMPAARREAVLNELMVVHSLHLRAPPKARPEPSPQDIVRQMQEEEAAPPLPQAEDGLDTNLGNLPTMPMAYEGDAPPVPAAGPAPDTGTATPQAADADPATAWVDSLAQNAWCKLYIQGRWATTRLLWLSDNRQFFMFTSRHGGGMHSLTRRALLRLRSEGLATTVEDRGLMQRAVDSLLGDLGD